MKQRDPGQELDHRVRRALKGIREQDPEWGTRYKEAAAKVLKRDPKLFRRWRKPPRSNPIQALKELADFLNCEEGRSLSETLTPIVAWKDYKRKEVAAAASALTKWLNQCIGQWVLLPSGRRKPTFVMTFPSGWEGVIASAIRYGDWRKLKRCPQCRRFFVATDHRRGYCKPGCFRLHEAERVKWWRTYVQEI